MADEIYMAPDQQTIDRIKQYKQSIADLQEQYKRIVDAHGELEPAAENLYRKILEERRALSQLIRTLSPAQAAMISFQESISKVTDAFGEGSKAAFSFASQFGGSLIRNLEEVGKIALISSKGVRDFVDPLGEARLLSRENTKVLGGLQQAMSRLFVAQRSARVAFTRLGLSIRDANRFSERYPQSLRAMSVEFNLSTKAIDEMVQKMSGVPPILANSEVGLRGVKNLQAEMTRAAAELATTMTAFGKSQQEAAKFGVDAWFDFNQESKETSRLLEIVNQTAVQNNVDLGKAVDQIARASQSMGIFGGKITASARIWHTFMGSLRESGVPINAIGSMVADLTDKMASMTVQNRAFIGLMSGMARGRTALGGALQMEINMRTPGGLERNLEAMTGTLSRFAGGRIITLEQAARSPQLEMQFVLQRQMLGKLTGITTTEQQNRILETLQRVQRGGMSRIQGSREVQSAMEKGKNIQERTLTAMERVDRSIRSVIGGKLDDLLKAVNQTIVGEGVGERGRLVVGGGLRGLERAAAAEPGPARRTIMRSALTSMFSQMRYFPENIRRAEAQRPGEAGLGAIFGDVIRAAEAGRRGGAPPEMPRPREATRPPLMPFLAATPGARRAEVPMFRAILPAGITRPAVQPEIGRMLPTREARPVAQPEMIRRVTEAMGPRPITPTAGIRAPEVTPAAVTRGAGGEYNINVKVSSDVPLGQAGMENLVKKLADAIGKDIESFSLSSILGHSD